MSKGLFMSMEDIDNELPVDENEAAEVAVTVADDSAEVQAAGDDVGTSVTEIEDAVQAGDELESVGEVAADAVESGEGLTEESAELVEIAVESILNRIGVRDTGRIVPATESFGNSNTRLAQTKVVLEGITDWVKKIWNAIKAGAARLLDKIKLFFISLFKSTEGLNKHIAGLKQRVNKLGTDVKPAEKSIKAPGVARIIGVKAKAGLAEFKAMNDNADKLTDVGVKICSQQRALVGHVNDMATKEMNEANVKDFLTKKTNIFDQVENIVGNGFKALATDLGTTLTAKQPKGKQGSVTTASYGPFPGATALVSTTRKNGTDVSFSLAFEGIKGAKGETVEALDISGMKEVLDISSKLIFKLNDMKKVQSEVEAVTKGVNKTADTVIASASKILNKQGSSTETRQGLADLKEAVTTSLNILSVIGNRAPALQYNLAKAGADYVSMCLRNMK